MMRLLPAQGRRAPATKEPTFVMAARFGTAIDLGRCKAGDSAARTFRIVPGAADTCAQVFQRN
jgi:hypothetical protein